MAGGFPPAMNYGLPTTGYWLLLFLARRRRRRCSRCCAGAKVRLVERRLGVVLHRVERFLDAALLLFLLEGGLHIGERRRLMRLDLDDVIAELRARHRRD